MTRGLDGGQGSRKEHGTAPEKKSTSFALRQPSTRLVPEFGPSALPPHPQERRTSNFRPHLGGHC